MAIRPLDFGSGDSIPGAIGRPAHLFWPVNAYRITLPRGRERAGHKLNPFERVVLELLEAVGRSDESAIAAETCIPDGLVRSVLLRLREKGLIDDNNVVIRRQNTESLTTQESIFTSAVVFRELVGGEVLPFVYVLDSDSDLGTKTERYDHVLRADREARRLGPPTAQEVVDAVSIMRRRASTHARSLRVPGVGEIRVGRDSEEHHLDCRVVILGFDGDFRVTDPFGIGYSPVLERVLTTTLATDTRTQDWMTDWRFNLLPKTPESRQQTPDFAAESIDHLFRELVGALTPSPGATFRTSAAIYAALEWALYHSCEAHDPEIAIKLLKTFDGDTYAERLALAARNVGFRPPKAGFRPVPSGKLRDFTNRKPEMETVVAIALVQADADPNHPLRTIADSYPDFIQRLRALGADKGNQVHGRNSAQIEDVELESDEMMRLVVTTLVPTIRFDEKLRHSNADARADLKLLARHRLIEHLGYDIFEKIGANARESLLAAEQFLGVCADGDDGRAFVTDLCSALQATLRHLFNGRGSVDVTDGQLCVQAESRSNRCGLGPLPLALKTVKPKRVRQALIGNDPTLGAQLIAILLVADEALLENIANSQHRFLSFVARLLELRGHANEPRPMSRAEALELGKTVTDTVVALAQINK